MSTILLILLIIFMAVFAIWTQLYVAEVNKNRLQENIKRYEKKKVKQQESKILASRQIRRPKNKEKSINVRT